MGIWPRIMEPTGDQGLCPVTFDSPRIILQAHSVRAPTFALPEYPGGPVMGVAALFSVLVLYKKHDILGL